MLLTIPTTFVPSTVAKSTEVNANFAAIATAFNTTAVQTDIAKTITVSHTQAADLLFADALYDIGKTGTSRPRDGFFSRNLSVGGVFRAGAGLGRVTGIRATGVAASIGTLDLSTNTGGGSYIGLLVVNNGTTSSADLATRTLFAVMGRGPSATFTPLATSNGTSGAATFTVTAPANGVIRVTNTSGNPTDVDMVFYGMDAL